MGASAAASISAARSTSSGAGCGGLARRYWVGAHSAGSPLKAPFMMFSGTSRWTTPGRPSQQARSAARMSSGMRS